MSLWLIGLRFCGYWQSRLKKQIDDLTALDVSVLDKLGMWLDDLDSLGAKYFVNKDELCEKPKFHDTFFPPKIHISTITKSAMTKS